MTECRDGCGACCDPVVLPFTAREFAMGAAGEDHETRRFVADSLTQLRRRDGLDRAPWFRGRTMVRDLGDVSTIGTEVFYECRHFDREERRCTNYADRPRLCRAFPWGDVKPHPAASLPPMCSFNADVGRTPEPIPVAWLPARSGQPEKDPL